MGFIKELNSPINASQDKIHVNYTSFSSMDQEYWTKILVMMAAREDVDVVGVNAVTDYVNFCNKGVLAPLNDLIEESGFDMSGYGALCVCKQDPV